MKQENVLVAKKDGKIVGFLSSDNFNFHGADSAICHFCGNAAVLGDRYSIYLSMYAELCKRCVEKGVLAHYVSIGTNDMETRNALFDLGFGSYGADAFIRFDKALSGVSDYEIGLAAVSDTQALYNLYNESVENLVSSPACLRMDDYSTEQIAQLIQSNRIYVARDIDNIIGFLHFRIADQNNIYRMYTNGCGLVGDEIGVYIKEACRGKGIGSHFMKLVSEYCIQNKIDCVHVPWETANPHANRFWRKFFTPTILGLKRTIHPDIREQTDA